MKKIPQFKDRSINQTAYFCSLESFSYCLFCIYPVFLDWSCPWNKNIQLTQFTLLFFRENRLSAIFSQAENSYSQGYHAQVHSTAFHSKPWMLYPQASIKQYYNTSLSKKKKHTLSQIRLWLSKKSFRASPGQEGRLVNLQQDLSSIVYLNSQIIWASVLSPDHP